MTARCCFQGNVFVALCGGLNKKLGATEQIINQGCLLFVWKRKLKGKTQWSI